MKFFKGCGKGLEEVLWQILDKTYCISNDGISILHPEIAACRIKGYKSLFSTLILLLVKALRRVDFPAFVYPTIEITGIPLFSFFSSPSSEI